MNAAMAYPSSPNDPSSYSHRERQRSRDIETHHHGRHPSSPKYHASPPKHSGSYSAVRRGSGGYHGQQPYHDSYNTDRRGSGAYHGQGPYYDSYNTDRRGSGGYHAQPPESSHRQFGSHHTSTHHSSTLRQEHRMRVEPRPSSEHHQRSQSTSWGTPHERHASTPYSSTRRQEHGMRIAPGASSGSHQRSQSFSHATPEKHERHTPQGRGSYGRALPNPHEESRLSSEKSEEYTGRQASVKEWLDKSSNARQSTAPLSHERRPEPCSFGAYSATRSSHFPQMPTQEPSQRRESRNPYAAPPGQQHDYHGHFRRQRMHSPPPQTEIPPSTPKLPDSAFDYVIDLSKRTMVENKRG
ncbi:hypothetical protein BGX38DRAFT_1268871 [Terfezia claveryi]|nr:hypothetical protein BGX38DRAFT_1268871 [Terfezia claveryi]